MTFIRRLLGVPAPVPAPARKAVTGPGVAAFYNDRPLSSLSPDPVDRAAAFLRAYKVGWFYKAESKISSDIANLKVSVSPEDESGDNEAARIEPDLFTPWEQLDPIGQFLRLMERPNPYQTGRQLRQKTQIRADMAGWTHWYMEGAGPVGSGVLPTALYGISPTRLTPSFDKNGVTIGWVLDNDKPGGGIPFPAYEILTFLNVGADDAWSGVGVVESVYSDIPLAAQFAQHTSDLLSTGGRLAGMLWPKERSLGEDEFVDAQRAWRNVSSDPNAAKRLLLFPEPMEYASGASTPAEIGIPELAALNRDNILTAFPISPYQLGVPMPGGLNSAETRREDRRDYWEGTIHPRVEMLEETIQTGMLSLYEGVVGSTYDFDIMEPNLDDAASLTLKVAAYNDLVTAGFDDKEARAAVGLDGIKYVALPALLDPVQQAAAAQAAAEARAAVPQPPVNEPPPATPAAKSASTREEKLLAGPTRRAHTALTSFFDEQRQRVIEGLRSSLPASKTARRDAIKADPDWWNVAAENAALTEVMRGVYLEVGREGLQAVADTLDRTVLPTFTRNVIADLLAYGGERVADINARTLQALVLQLAEGTRRGYSVNQLIDGVAEEGFAGVSGVALENGTPAFGELRAETIARTETMLSYNRANVQGYAEFGVAELLAYDGDGDEECADRDGQTFSIDDALAIEDHPNGTLAWAPVTDKAMKPVGLDPLLAVIEALNTIKAMAERDQPAPVTNVHIDGAKVTAEPAQVTVNVPETVVNIAAPDVNVPATVVNVVPPEVVVNVPEIKSPDVTVNIPPATARKVVRGLDGRIEGLE